MSNLLPEEKRDFIDITTRRMPLDMNCAFQVSSPSPKRINFKRTEKYALHNTMFAYLMIKPCLSPRKGQPTASGGEARLHRHHHETDAVGHELCFSSKPALSQKDKFQSDRKISKSSQAVLRSSLEEFREDIRFAFSLRPAVLLRSYKNFRRFFTSSWGRQDSSFWQRWDGFQCH